MQLDTEIVKQEKRASWRCFLGNVSLRSVCVCVCVCVSEFRRKPHFNFGAESGAGLCSFPQEFVNTHRATYCHKLGEHRSSLHRRVEQASDTKLDNIKHISRKFDAFVARFWLRIFIAVCLPQAKVYA
jgi:hypothetical protein